MYQVDVTAQWVSKMRELAVLRTLSIPLMQIGEMVLFRIRDRVSGGRAPIGMFRQLGSDFEGVDYDRWWVPPGQPQPSGYLTIVQSGEFAGWAIYDGYKKYLDSLPDKRTRKWTKTGEFWRATGVKYINAKRVKVSSFGRRKSGNGTIANAQVGYLAGRNERFNVFEPSQEERDEALAMAADLLTENLRRAIGIVAEQQAVAKRARSANRRASKLLRMSGG